MDKSKIIPVILGVIILLVGVIAVNFHREKTQLERVQSSLLAEKENLERRFRGAQDEARELSRRFDGMRAELSRVEQQRDRASRDFDNLRSRYSQIERERDELVERLSERPERPRPTRPDPDIAERDESHWADFVQKKAELETKVKELEEEMLAHQSRMANMRQDNRKLSLEIDELSKEKDRLSQEIRRQERTLRTMSTDLVSERHRRTQAVEELMKLRGEVSNLKHELITANRRKGLVQNRLKDVIEERNALERKVSHAENILKEKSLVFSELHSGLTQAIKEGKDVASRSPGSIDLPPIVVRPEAPELRGMRGEVIAVNPEERFVVFDLGEDSGLRPGVVLWVVRGDKEIGIVEVIETRKNISAADIKEVSSGFSIREGDSIITAR